MGPFRIVSTTADIGIQLEAESEGEFFKNALLGLHGLLFESSRVHLPDGGEENRFPIDLKGDSTENLLVKFLEEILFITYNKRVQVVDVHIKKLSSQELSAELIGIESPRPPSLEIKSVTYHNLRIERREGHLSCRIIFDI